MEILNYKGDKRYTLGHDSGHLNMLTPSGEVYKMYKEQIGYNILCRILGINSSYEFTTRDVNALIISFNCQLCIRVDKYNNPIIGRVEKGYENYLYIAIDESLQAYVAEGSRQLYHYSVTEKVYMKIFRICTSLFGEELCRQSALTYAQARPIYEKYDSDGTVTLTGEFYKGTKKPKTEGLLSSLFIHEKGFVFSNKKSYSIDELPAKEIYDKLSDTYRSLWKHLFLCMQPSGEWWISNGMEFDSRYGIGRWKRFDSSVYFSPFDLFNISPVDDCRIKYYLSEKYNPQ
jgi:hypothetical protein